MATDEQRKQWAAASRKWREAHPDKSKQVEREAYHRKRDRLGLSKPKIRTEAERKESKRAWRKRWVLKNKERVAVIRKRYYDAHADEANSSRKVPSKESAKQSS